MQIGFILTIGKNVQDRFHSLMSILIITYAQTLTAKDTDSFQLAFFIDTGKRLCHHIDAGVYKWLLHHGSQGFCLPIANRCPENAKPVSTL